MSLLIPGWTFSYPEFWNTIRRRNLWFIKIRYVASISLFLFLFLAEYILNLKFTILQIQAIGAISFSIFLYNVFFHVIRKYVTCEPDKFNCMHLSLLQMLADLTSLMLLVYFTGLIESPIYVFFIFHMVIGSLILPGIIIYSICGIIVFAYSLLIFLQLNDIIPTHSIEGLTIGKTEITTSYEILFIAVFSLMMFMTVVLANHIAKNLLKREEQLRIALEKINQAEIAKQKYIVGIVHEIKSPFAAVKSLVEVILKKYLGPISNEVEERLKRVNLRVDEGLELINNILRISRLKLLQVNLFESIILNNLINEILLQKAELLTAKKINVQLKCSSDTDIIFVGDRDLLNLAFSNLISNAIKYTEPYGNLLIELNEEINTIHIKIIDDGIGIPKKDLDKVFDQFYRGSNLNHYKVEGSGLGLSLVKEIIKYHNGNITVYSPSALQKDGRPGSCFEIIFQKELDNSDTEDHRF